MKKSLASGVGVAAAFVVVFGSSANANPYDTFYGVTYARAQELTSLNVKIGTRVGEYLPTEQCVITGSRRPSNSNSIVVDLNCNDTYAGATGHPGNSAATPEGQKALKLIQQAKAISSGYAKAVANGTTNKTICFTSDSYAKWCANVCTKSGACSAELSDALGL